MLTSSLQRLMVAAAIVPVSNLVTAVAADSSVNGSNPIVVNGRSFALNGDNVSYRFHVDNDTFDLVTDHFGGPADEDGLDPGVGPINGWVGAIGRIRREFPDRGRGDFRLPAIEVLQSEGYAVSQFLYQSHKVMQGKPSLAGLPATFGKDDEVSTLVVHMYDNHSSVAADLSYSIFPARDAIVRSVNITNHGDANITVNRIASFSVDLPYEDLDMIQLSGDWAREAHRLRRRVAWGRQGFDSGVGYSSHLHNPFLALTTPQTTESFGEAWGFSFIYTGSFAVDVEKASHGYTRAMIGLNPDQLSWSLGPGHTFTSPEAVAIYSSSGIGGMSRAYHRLWRQNLIKSSWVDKVRPPLLNSWEGLGFDYNESTIYRLAQQSAQLGAKMFVLDDGWFGVKYPRVSDNAGLGDWQPNPERFPDGLTPLVKRITALKTANTSENLRFGLWFEPEMVNPNSSLYHKHPDWALHAGTYPRSLQRNQLVLNLARPEIQDFVINAVSSILSASNIGYVKWDNNRGIHETPSPSTDHAYMLGLYKVFRNLTSQFPDVIWEGCASGGGRFDPGVLQYFPQIWTSDDTDAAERIKIQFGTSLVYPPAVFGAHVSAVPNGVTYRNTSIAFRSHVAMMGGSYGLELDPSQLEESDRAQVPDLIKLQEKAAPIIMTGDMWRLNLPEESNWPATMFISQDGKNAVVFYYQIQAVVNQAWPQLRLQGLDPKAKYTVDGNMTFSGSTLMNIGLGYQLEGDYDSRVIFLEKQ